MNLLRNIKPKHGFYDLNGDLYITPDDKFLGGDEYKTQDISIYVHKDNVTATFINIGFEYDKCSKSILKRGGDKTIICRNHDGWFGAEFLGFIKSNIELYHGLILLFKLTTKYSDKKVVRKLQEGFNTFVASYHAAATIVFGYPFRWYQEKRNKVSHSDDEILKNRKFVRLFKWDSENKIWNDVTDLQNKWNGEKIV